MRITSQSSFWRGGDPVHYRIPKDQERAKEIHLPRNDLETTLVGVGDASLLFHNLTISLKTGLLGVVPLSRTRYMPPLSIAMGRQHQALE
jgi:hypothetical protein